MSDANIAAIQDLYAKFGAGDIAGIVASVTPDVAWGYVGQESDYPVFGARRGPAGVGAFFERVGANEDIRSLDAREFHASADKVFVLGHAEYVLKASGKPVSTDFIHVFTLKGGKVARFDGFLDTAKIVAAYRG
ncbi:MAG TPA: nuclear transport factor 2 family protein [Caulobacteraceae bacterium]|nr:nuclear transport factor 2 family protein [Caulobacteraceae bacterium]